MEFTTKSAERHRKLDRGSDLPEEYMQTHWETGRNLQFRMFGELRRLNGGTTDAAIPVLADFEPGADGGPYAVATAGAAGAAGCRTRAG
jgi:hypothetical protein